MILLFFNIFAASGAPASFVSEWGERRHRAPNVARRQSMREIAERESARIFVKEKIPIRRELCCCERNSC